MKTIGGKKFKKFMTGAVSILFLLILIQFPAFFQSTIAESELGDDEQIGTMIDSRTPRSREVIERPIPDKEVMYAIITPQNFSNLLIPLANWKTYKGVPAKIYTLESIYANFTSGRDDAENVHEFLQNLKSKSSALTWLLLVGDSDIVPVRKLWANGGKYSIDNEYYSDYYYAGLGNDWDVNNDEVYGDGTAAPDSEIDFEGDWSADVYVGRLPVGSPIELNNSINDILTYERNPPQGNWMKRAILWGGLMNAPNVPQYDPNSWNAYRLNELMVKPIIEGNASHMEIKTRYDYSQLQGGNYNINNDLLTRANAITDFQPGAALLNYGGQAYYTGNALVHYNDASGEVLIGDGSYSPLFNWDDAQGATNGMKLPLVTLFTCGVGNFSKMGTYEDKTMERFLTAPNGGAIGVVGSTGKVYRGEMPKSDGNWWMDQEFYKIFFSGTYQPGKALYDMKWNYKTEILDSTIFDNEKYKALLFGYNYMGDPELNIWTDLPGELDVNVTGLWLGPHNISVSVHDKYYNVVPNARVCIQNDELYAYGVTNSTGQAKIWVYPTQQRPVDIVVTAHNFLPYEDSATIGIEPVDLEITSSDIEFSTNNPIVNQQITINASILNRGQTDMTTTVNVRFSVDGLVGSGGTQIGSLQTISGLVKSASKSVSVTWDVTDGNHEIFVQVDPENAILESYNWNNMASKSIYVSKPEFCVLTDDITFEPSTNIYDGKIIQITAKIYNIGDGPATNVKVSFIDKSDTVADKYIGNKTISFINHGLSKDVTINWQTVGGEHEIIVTIDPENQWKEFNETNNTAAKNISIRYPPVITELPDRSFDEDHPLPNATRLIYFISDEDNDLQELTIVVESSDENLNVTMNKYYALDIIPAPDWFGTANVTVTASDELVAVNGTFKVTVNPVNDPPRFEGTNFSLVALEDAEFSYVISAFDIEDDPVSFFDDCEFFDIVKTTGEIRFTPDQEHVNKSSHKLNITLSDGTDYSPPIEFNLTVINSPDAPLLNDIPTQYADQGKPFDLKIKALDIDSIDLYFYDNTTMFVIGLDTGIISFTPGAEDVGTHFIKIIVSDETHKSTNLTFKMIVNKTDDIPSDGDDGLDGDGEIDSGSSTSEFEVAGVPIIYLVVVLIIIIVVLIVLFLLLKKKKGKEKSIRDNYFSPDYDKSKSTLEAGHKKQESSSYEDEYRSLYSTAPPSETQGESEVDESAKSVERKKDKQKGKKVVAQVGKGTKIKIRKVAAKPKQ